MNINRIIKHLHVFLIWQLIAFILISFILGLFKYGGISYILRGDAVLFIVECFKILFTLPYSWIVIPLFVGISFLVQYNAILGIRQAKLITQNVVILLVILIAIVVYYNRIPCEELGCIVNAILLFIEAAIWYIGIAVLPVSVTVMKLNKTDISLHTSMKYGIFIVLCALITILIPHTYILMSAFNDFKYSQYSGR